MLAVAVSAASGPGAIVSLDLAILCSALALEALLGYPDAVFRAIGHPVTWIGALIAWLDRTCNHPAWSDGVRRLSGVAALAALLAVAVGLAILVQHALLAALPGWMAMVALAILANTLLAQRSLWAHVAAVADGLRDGGLAGGRLAVSQIVGRNPATLDEAGVIRAAIESLAENFSDGVVAPALWCAMFGLPGIVFYKAGNTADSMIGHLTPRHAAFGWAAARLDDLINLPASRLAAIWIAAAAALHGTDWRAARRRVTRDAGRHRSPNAGWPEAAMAGALGLRLGGPRVYGTTLVEDAWMGDGRAEATPDDLRQALSLYCIACAIQWAFFALLLLIWRG